MIQLTPKPVPVRYSDPDEPFIWMAFWSLEGCPGWHFIPKMWADAVTHWMPLPDPPTK